MNFRRPFIRWLPRSLFDSLSVALAVGILSGTFLSSGATATPFLAAGILTCAAIPILARVRWSAWTFWKTRTWLLIGLVAGVFLLGQLPSWYRFFPFALALACLAELSDDDAVCKRFRIMAGASLLFAGFDLMRAAGPLANVLPATADFLCDHFGTWGGMTIRRGALHLGLPVLFWAALVLVGIRSQSAVGSPSPLPLSPRGRGVGVREAVGSRHEVKPRAEGVACTWGKVGWGVLIPVLLLFVVMLVHIYLENGAVLWLATGAILGWAAWGVEREPPSAPPSALRAPRTGIVRWSWIPLAAGACAAAAWLGWLPRGERDPGTILISMDGYFSLESASDAKIGPEMGGLPPFGLMRDLLTLRGTPVQPISIRSMAQANLVLRRIGTQTVAPAGVPLGSSIQAVASARVAEPDPLGLGRFLHGARTLIFINPSRMMTEAERSALDRWVREGGRLLVLGDHTNVENMMEVINPLIEPMGIAFRFDATCMDADARIWFRGIGSHQHPTTLAESAANFRTGIGASLKLTGAARPILAGQGGFSDDGDPENGANAFLGNMVFDPWEKKGDMVLAATAEVGKGRILIYGDTLAFANDSLPHNWDNIIRAFEFLESTRSLPDRWLPGVLLTVGLLSLWWFKSCKGALVVSAAGLTATLLCIDMSNRHTWHVHFPEPNTLNTQPSPPDRGPLSTDPRTPSPLPHPDLSLALVDLAHHPTYDRNYWGPDGLDGLFVNLRRNGYFPVTQRRWDRELVAQAKLLVLPASMCGLSAREEQDVEHALEQGSVAVVTCGQRARGLAPWLQRRGLTLETIPLGPAEHEVSTAMGVPPPVFHSAWPWKWHPDTPVQTLVTVSGKPVVVQQAVGHSRLVAIGDGHFFTNKNLESLQPSRSDNEFSRYQGQIGGILATAPAGPLWCLPSLCLKPEKPRNVIFTRWLFGRTVGGAAP